MRSQLVRNWRLRQKPKTRIVPKPTPAPMPPPNPVNVIHLQAYTGYRHKDKDPILYTVLELLRKSNRSNHSIAIEAGISPLTIQRWEYGITRRPQVTTIRAVLRVLGYDLVLSRKQ